MTFPYENATSGVKARGEITKILRRFGCDSIGFMDEFASKELLLAFKWRGRTVQLRASAQGWANAYLKEHPWTTRRRCTRHQHEQQALDQGMISIESVLRDWVKGNVTAVETGILSFEHVFVAHMLTTDGTPVLEHIAPMLPAIEGPAP